MSQLAFASWFVALTLAATQAALSTPATGHIAGRVLDDATHQPLANARVFLYPNPFAVDGRAAFTMTIRMATLHLPRSRRARTD